ncbi:tripartite tricarboxylate transporter substrate binding protein [Roseiarcaceae bacterium H3SJ34-1]|uniref:Bug family tripartite tricarboxylate transporter substrate binding protein n=1 Tax=Terripilifer ovatus TaxID=3032367 RepID=UPI003AB944DB|nr:tripartite tricarboxylate transporter substrate binding protein [Roseiarcaceae bacterium H3SJ34-1]
MRFYHVFLACFMVATGAQAQTSNWPDKPVRIVVSQPAGAAPDVIARMIADSVSASLKQQVYVENRPGAANIVGSQAVARATPDGYTFLFATTAAIASNPFTFASLPYDPEKDFTPVAMIARGPFFLLVHPSVKANSLSELIALDKADPGKLSIATEGPRNFTGILAAWINRLAGTHMVEVPYQTITQGIQDAISGRVQVINIPIVNAVPFIQSKELKPLAVSSLQPMPKFEDIPPIAGTLAGVDMIGWFALVAPSGTPDAIVQRMNREVDRVLTTPAMKERLLGFGFFTEGAETTKATGDYIRSQRETWGKVIKTIGLEPL